MNPDNDEAMATAATLITLVGGMPILAGLCALMALIASIQAEQQRTFWQNYVEPPLQPQKKSIG